MLHQYKVFIVGGGNDAQNCRSDSDLLQIVNSFNSLLHYIKSCFPAVVVNVLSVIPRKLADSGHLNRMMWVNSFMRNSCSVNNCRFVDIFTHYLKHSWKFVTEGKMIMKRNLYSKDMIHFSDIGTSVLAKTIIGVIYLPRY